MGLRLDGYHLLDSLVTFVPSLSDYITLEEAAGLSFTASGLMPDNAMGMSNIAVKAAKAVARLAGRTPDVRIEIQKNIPAGAGLGGGSSDAAAVIKGLEKLWGLSLDADERLKIMLSLGADVPICYHAKPCRFEGIGEIISDIPALPRFSLFLVWPDCHTATKDVFKVREPEFQKERTDIPSSFADLEALIRFLEYTGNDLQGVAQKITPPISNALSLVQSQQGCLLARMSGSGSCVFGIFGKPSLCEAAQAAVNSRQPAWWTHTSAV